MNDTNFLIHFSGIGDDEDLTLYESEELQVAPSSQSPVSVEQSPVNQQQSQLITQLRSPPQVPSQVNCVICFLN